MLEVLEKDDDLDKNIKNFLHQHKLQKKRGYIDKERSSSNILLEKYDTCRALALKTRNKLEEERRARKKELNEQAEDDAYIKRIAAAEKSEQVIKSPVRGKMRPRSAPARRPIKSQSAPNLRATSPELYTGVTSPVNRSTNQITSPVWSPPGKHQQFDNYDTAQNPDQWWYDKTLNHVDADKRPKTPNSTRKTKQSSNYMASNGMTHEELKESLRKSRSGRPKRIPPSVHLQNYRDKQKEHDDAIAKAVMEEAFLMESRAYACVEEACAYAKSLGLKKRYSVFSRTAAESAHGKSLARAYSTPLMGKNEQALPNKTIEGAGRRIERMMIEVMGVAGEPTQLLSLDKFYAEHDKLQMEVRRQRNLMPSAQRAEEMKLEKEQDISTQKPGGGVKRRGTKHMISFDDMKANTDKKKHPEVNTKVSKKEKMERLNKILADTVDVTKVLEDQLKELQSRGWNESVL